MSTIESTDAIAPKSVLRHRPIGDSKPPTGQRSVVTTAAVPVVPRSSRMRFPVDPEDVPPKAAKEFPADKSREKSPAPIKGQTKAFLLPATKALPDTPPPKSFFPRRHFALKGWHTHPLLYCGLGMLGMILLWTLGNMLSGWLIMWHDDIQYGRPRTYQVDAWVGHNEQGGTPSHFIALNLNHHVEVIELPGGDASHARIYSGPQVFGPNNDLVPITLRFVDVNNDHKPDMLVLFQGSSIVYLNDQGTFRPPLPVEHAVVAHFLQQLQLH